MSAIDVVVRALESAGIRFALIGGRAVAARGHPRMTLDYDFLVTDPNVLRTDLWAELVRTGVRVTVRRGEHDDPIGGVVRIMFPDGLEADILLAKWKWEEAILERAERLDVGGITMPVPVVSDLVLLKLAAGGPIDLQDVIALLAADSETVVHEVDQKVAALPSEIRETWKRVRPDF